jgi:GH25 family lysozyme M1 (1,4-beta-N-acetylmuramidase)
MWIARYNKKEPRFADWTMWQFTEEAIVYGANGGFVDLSVIKQQP